MSYVKEFQRSRWPRAAQPSGQRARRIFAHARETAERSRGETRRAQGGYGAIPRQDFSPMLWHRIRRPSLSGTRKTPVRGRTPLVQTIPNRPPSPKPLKTRAYPPEIGYHEWVSMGGASSPSKNVLKRK
jgi:hypothetical protein